MLGVPSATAHATGRQPDRTEPNRTSTRRRRDALLLAGSRGTRAPTLPALRWPPADPHCPPPPMPCHEGTVKLPPHDPPPAVMPSRPTTDAAGKGDPGEPVGSGSRSRGIEHGGPTFGPRKNEYLPYLLVRSNPGDRGARPVTGVFWDRPTSSSRPAPPATAPLMPADRRCRQRRSAHHALRARVEPRTGAGLGRVRGVLLVPPEPRLQLRERTASAPRWSTSATASPAPPTGARSRAAGDRYLTRGCHAIVRCPETWVPTWENGGHECLVVRVFEPFMDAVALTNYDARSTATSASATSPSSRPLRPPPSISLDVGPTAARPRRGGGERRLTRPRCPGSTSRRSRGNPAAAGRGAGRGRPAPAHHRLGPAGELPDSRPNNAGRSSASGNGSTRLRSTADRIPRRGQPRAGEAHVLRVRQRVEGTLVGGYTVVLCKR